METVIIRVRALIVTDVFNRMELLASGASDISPRRDFHGLDLLTADYDSVAGDRPRVGKKPKGAGVTDA